MKDCYSPVHFNEVPDEEQPEKTIETVPDELIQNTIERTIYYGECPDCGTRQFYRIIPGHNFEHDCRNCGMTIDV